MTVLYRPSSFLSASHIARSVVNVAEKHDKPQNACTHYGCEASNVCIAGALSNGANPLVLLTTRGSTAQPHLVHSLTQRMQTPKQDTCTISWSLLVRNFCQCKRSFSWLCVRFFYSAFAIVNQGVMNYAMNAEYVIHELYVSNSVFRLTRVG